MTTTPLEKRNRVLFEAMMNTESLVPRLTLPKVLALIIASLIHSVTLVFVVIGLYFFMLVVKLGNGPAIFVYGLFGILFLAIGWMVAPRFPQPKNLLPLPRKKFPILYALVDRIAERLEIDYVDGIVVTPDYNAYFGHLGVLKQRRLLLLGIPLWSVLNNQERVALIAHELSHDANGDFGRNLVVGTAYGTLERWCLTLHPHVVIPHFQYVFMLAFSGIVWNILLVLRRLLFHESRRAEYLADSLAATISGSDSMISMLYKIGYADEFYAFVRKMTKMQRADRLIEKFKNYITDMPEEKQTVIDKSRIAREKLYNLTHPPLEYRIDFIKARHSSESKVTLTDLDASIIETEMTGMQRQVEDIIYNLQPDVFIVR